MANNNNFYITENGVAAYLSGGTKTVTTTLAGTYYPVPGIFTNEFINGFDIVVVDPSIRSICGCAKKYEIDIHASLESNTNNTDISITVSIYDDSAGTWTDKTSWKMDTFLKNIGQIYSLSGTIVVELDNLDKVQLIVSSNQAGAILTFDTFTTTIREFLQERLR